MKSYGKHRITGMIASVMLLGAVSAGALAAARIPEETEGTEGAGAAGSYILRELEGYIAVYEEGEKRREPLLVTDIELRNLPEADREELRRGMAAESHAELMQLLEDLGS